MSMYGSHDLAPQSSSECDACMPLQLSFEAEHDAVAQQRVLQQLREERIRLDGQLESMKAQLAAASSDLANIPLLEQELLFHAGRADAMEQQVVDLGARNGQLEVLAHGRARSRAQLASATQVIRFCSFLGLLMAAHAIRTWREAVVVLDHTQRDADLARLQYQNLLMQRAAYAQCVQSKQESAATIIWQSWRRLEYSLLARTIAHWHRVPRALAMYSYERQTAPRVVASMVARQ